MKPFFETPGTIPEGEYHPAANSAMKYVMKYLIEDVKRVFRLKEAFASSAISGNKLGDICGETLNRIMTGQNVSDRYLLGLSWTIKQMEEVEEYIAMVEELEQLRKEVIELREIKSMYEDLCK